MKTYYLYTIQAYEHMDPGTGNMSNVTVVKLLDPSPFAHDDVIKKAKKMIKKIGYRVAEIGEYFYPQEEMKDARSG